MPSGHSARHVPDKGAYLPTPEEIAAECQRIRSRWSELEHKQRVVRIPGRAMPQGGAEQYFQVQVQTAGFSYHINGIAACGR